jgi:hypothetical protein
MTELPYSFPAEGLQAPPSSAGLVCSILSCVFGGIAFLCFPPVFGLAGLVLGIIGVCLSRDKGIGIVGIVLSVVGTVLGMALGMILWMRH